MHDLELPFYVQFSIFTITNRVSAIRLHIYRRPIYSIFLLYDVTKQRCSEADCDPKNIADTAYAKGLRIFRRRKVAALDRRKLNTKCQHYIVLLSFLSTFH